MILWLFQWNNHGYDVAKIFANKFSMVSPVWLQVVPEGSKYIIKGEFVTILQYFNRLNVIGYFLCPL